MSLARMLRTGTREHGTLTIKHVAGAAFGIYRLEIQGFPQILRNDGRWIAYYVVDRDVYRNLLDLRK